MKKLLKILAGTVVGIAALALILAGVILVRADRRFDARIRSSARRTIRR
jgi:hypothetical protein